MDRYLDRPDLVDQAVINDLASFELGYAHCLSKLIEQLHDTKVKLLVKCMDYEDTGIENEKQFEMLQTRYQALDIYDRFLTKQLLKLTSNQSDEAATL